MAAWWAATAAHSGVWSMGVEVGWGFGVMVIEAYTAGAGGWSAGTRPTRPRQSRSTGSQP